MKRLSIIFVSLLAASFSIAQEGETSDNDGGGENTTTTTQVTEIQALRAEDNGGYNPLSRRPIHLSNQMYRKTLWRKLDLREKQNLPLFSEGRELSRIFIDAVRSGKLIPYSSDSTNRPMSIDEFNTKLTVPGQDTEEEEDGFEDEGGWGDEEGGDEGGGWGDDDAGPAEEISPYYLENTLYVFELKEDMIFDKQRSRMFYDIQSIGMFVPADNADNLKQLEDPIAYFRYVDLVDKVFNDDPRAFWYNPINDAQHRSLQDCFDLRLFSSYITKVSNPKNEVLEDIYGSPEAGVRASYKTMYDLLEYEHNLWEY